MPAAAVIPAPLAYIKVVAVKKLVVEFWAGSIGMRSLWLLGTSGSHIVDRIFPIGTRCFVT